MRHYDPDKMIPVEALGPIWSYVFNGGKVKVLGFKPITPCERQTLKKYHKRRCRRINKKIEQED